MEKLLILHGALGSKSQFDTIISSFSNKLDVYFLEFSGHGVQPFKKEFSVQQFSKELNAYINKNSLQGCHVFGYSMGGYVALYHALSNPEIFSSIQTLATKFSWSPEIAGNEIKKLDPEKIIIKVPEFAEDLDYRHNDWRQLMATTSALMTGLGDTPLLDDDNLQSVTLPVRIMRGGLDPMVTEEESKWVVNALPNAVYIEIPEAKHPIEKFEPTTLTKLIESNILGLK